MVILLAGMALLVPSPLPAQDRFFAGATAGVSMTSLSGDVPPDGGYTSKIGFSGGVIGEYALTTDIRISLQPSFERRGTGVAFDTGEDELRDSLDVTLDYLSIPLLARFLSPGGSWFVNGGFDLGFLLAASVEDIHTGRTMDAKEFISSVDLMMVVGVGAAFPVDPAVLLLELRYAQSVLNAGDNTRLEAATGVPPRFRSSGFQLVAAVLLPL